MASKQGIPTQYSGCSDVALYSMFRTDEWNRSDVYITPEQRAENRAQALQELSNRASRDYNSTPVSVQVKDMQGFGSYNNGTQTISVSQSMVNNGAVLAGNGQYYSCEPSNLRAMANVYHETWHSAQHQAEKNPDILIGDEETRNNVIANLHYYISPSPSTGDLYRIQIAEKQANEYAEAKTIAAIKSTEPYFGKEAHLENFQGSLTSGYDRALARAQLHYNDPNIDKTLQTAINDCHYNNGAIQSNMPYSYYQIRTIFVDQQLEAINKTPDPSIYKDQVDQLNKLRDEIHQTGMKSAAVQAQLQEAGLQANGAAAPTANPATSATATATSAVPSGGTTAEATATASPGSTVSAVASEDSAASAPAASEPGGETTSTESNHENSSSSDAGSSLDSDDGMSM